MTGWHYLGIILFMCMAIDFFTYIRKIGHSTKYQYRLSNSIGYWLSNIKYRLSL